MFHVLGLCASEMGDGQAISGMFQVHQQSRTSTDVAAGKQQRQQQPRLGSTIIAIIVGDDFLGHPR
jgi:hypothetical protein